MSKKRRAPGYGAFFISATVTRVLFYALLFAWAQFSWAAADFCKPEHFDETVVVTRIFDGTPEVGGHSGEAEPHAIEARQYLADLLASDRHIGLVYDQLRYDKYDRLLAYVYRNDGLDLARVLLQRGLAVVLVMPPNVKNAACYAAAELSARRERRGLWSHYYQPGAAQQRVSNNHSFRVVKGKLARLRNTRRSIWLYITGDVSLRIDRNDLGYFSEVPSARWIGKEIVASGWLVSYRNGLYMRIRHPSALREAAKPDQ